VNKISTYLLISVLLNNQTAPLLLLARSGSQRVMLL